MLKSLLLSFLFISICFSNEDKYIDHSDFHSKKRKKEIIELLSKIDSTLQINTIFVSWKDAVFDNNSISYLRLGHPEIDSSFIIVSENGKDIKYIINKTNFDHFLLPESSYKQIADSLDIYKEIYLQFNILKEINTFKPIEVSNGYFSIFRIFFFIIVILIYIFFSVVSVLIIKNQFQNLMAILYIKKKYSDLIKDYHIYKIGNTYDFFPEIFKYTKFNLVKRFFCKYIYNDKWQIDNEMERLKSYIIFEKLLERYKEIQKENDKFKNRIKSFIDSYSCEIDLLQNKINQIEKIEGQIEHAIKIVFDGSFFTLNEICMVIRNYFFNIEQKISETEKLISNIQYV
jgi:hypothetical protein